MMKIISKFRQKNIVAKRGFVNSGNKGIMFAVFILGSMLIALAILQYHWLDQLGEGEKVRLKNNLKISAQRFAEDFDEELTKIYNSFSEAKSHADLNFSNLQGAFERANKILSNPALIDKAFLIEIENSNKFIIKQQIPKQITADVHFPKELIEIKEQLTKDSFSFLQSLISLSHAPILDKKNALIIINLTPITFINLDEERNTSFIVITLNRSELIGFLDSLNEKYFYADSMAVYNTAIIKADSNKTTFYKSDSSKSDDYYLSNSDESVEIAKWRTSHLMVATAKIGIIDSIQHDHPLNIDLKKKEYWSVQVDTLEKEESFRFMMSKIIPWRLYIKNISGNIDNLIRESRLRNLVISYLIIVILGISVGFVFYTSHKAKKIARGQIEFVAGLTHELRTPLASIRSAAENLKDGILDSAEQQKKYGRLIYKENLRLSNMIEQTLQFAGISNGSHENIEVINLSKLTNDIIRELDPASNRSIKLNIAETINIKFNKNALTIIVRNLISNALKYSKDPEDILVHVALKKPDGSFTFEITDHGSGIDESDLAHIFDPFYRGNFAKENQIAGSGIGLSLVKKIVDEHDGQINVSSTPGKGSIFSIKIPLQD
ncbi:MAG: sensor histidine kinase [Calditrichaeota bacterium]|nr:MAG: sensor histidine kinase [Calditrichota bacterium]MBL1207296.1 sensor histidine kinase [Calditrichota bacterium]NOG47128.1 HAMP domain-containing histidine kinase [Calditrichota bacterium]